MTGIYKYTLDANIFIEAHRRYYAFNLCPGFWQALVWHEAGGRLGSIDKVQDELEEGSDELAAWVKNSIPASCFASTAAPNTIACFTQVVSWAQAQVQFNPEAKSEFAGNTDGWLVAHAKANDLVVVTHEVIALDARRRVPIPNVCQAFGVQWIDTFEMLRRLNTKFNWQPPS